MASRFQVSPYDVRYVWPDHMVERALDLIRAEQADTMARAEAARMEQRKASARKAAGF